MEMLTLETMPEFDQGSVAIAVNQAIQAAYHDCRDRPGMKTKRQVTLKLEFVPLPDPHSGSELDAVEFTASVESKCPAKGVTKQVKCVPRMAGFGFHTDTDSIVHDPDQRAFQYGDDD